MIIDEYENKLKRRKNEKKCLIYFQSFNGLDPNISLNDRFEACMLEPLIYDFMFSRLYDTYNADMPPIHSHTRLQV